MLLVDRSKLARKLGVSATTVDRLERLGVIPARLAGTRYWVLDHVEQRLRSSETLPASAENAFDQWKRARDARSA